MIEHSMSFQFQTNLFLKSFLKNVLPINVPVLLIWFIIDGHDDRKEKGKCVL